MTKYIQVSTLATYNLLNGVEGVIASSIASGDLGQEDFGVTHNKTDGLSSIESEDDEEGCMSKFTQYIGYVQEANGYYNFWPIYVVDNGTIELFNTRQEMFPQLGNVNLSSKPLDYVKKNVTMVRYL